MVGKVPIGMLGSWGWQSGSLNIHERETWTSHSCGGQGGSVLELPFKWKTVKLLMTYQNRRSKMSLKLVVSCFSSRKLESWYSWHFTKDQLSFIHIISCYPQTFSESKYLRLSVATYFALIYNFHVTFFIRKLQTLQNIKVQACRFCILSVLS